MKNELPEHMEGKLNIYMHIAENSGVGYYRQYLPAVKLREHKSANVLISDFRWGEGDHQNPDQDLLFSICNWADIIVAGRQDLAQYYSNWGGVKEFFNIPIIMDTDDNVQFVRPSNPGYAGYQPGAESLVWNKFAISKIFNAITVTTDDLKKFYEKLNPKIYVLPNNLDVADWDKYPSPPKDEFIRFAFIGSSAHTEGIQIIKKSVVEMLTKYPHTKFLLTHTYMSLFADCSEEIKKRIEPIPWIKLQDWPKEVKKLGIDIGLAPLADNMFNRSKSNLRWMEYAIAGMCPIVSPVAAYACVKDGFNGIIAKERNDWFNALEKLILNEELREAIAKNAADTIRNEYNIDKNIGLWENTYREIHDKYHSFFGEKKKFEKISKKKYRKIN